MDNFVHLINADEEISRHIDSFVDERCIGQRVCLPELSEYVTNFVRTVGWRVNAEIIFVSVDHNSLSAVMRAFQLESESIRGHHMFACESLQVEFHATLRSDFR